MKKNTVRRRIFLSNACMVIVALGMMLLVNLGVVKVYWETIEKDWKTSVESMADSHDVEDMLEEWTVHQKSFYVLFVVDVSACVVILICVSSLFTGALVRHFMRPLDALDRGAKRIQENHLTEEIVYHGDVEFEEICNTFNEMQGHLLEEQEKNRKYEKARTEMIAGISHDLRTPLTAIKGTIKGLLDGVVKEPEQQNKFLQTAYRRTEDMDVLLNQLFYLSKLDTGNMPIYLQKTELPAFLEKYVEGKRETLNMEEVELTFESRLPDEEDQTVQIDLEQFQRILDNLLENSRKYAEVHPLKVQITLEQAGENLRVCFKDNGQGVPEKKLEFIFDEFYRADESRNKKDGNGLGLYIVKSLIEAMGGQVRAENNNGLNICMELPKGE